MKVMHKLLLLSVLPFLVIILSIIFVSKHQSESILRRRITESTTLELNLYCERIEAFIFNKVDELKLMGSAPVVQRGNIPEILSYFGREQKRLSRHIEGIYYNDLEGTVYDVAGATFSVRDRYYFPQIARGEVVITKMIKSRATQKPIVLMLVPIFDTDGKRMGAVGGTILVKELLQMIMDIKVGQSGFAIMVDEDDRVVSSFGKPRNTGKDLYFKPLDAANATEGMGKLIKDMRSQDHNATGVVYDKFSYLAFFKPISTLGWSLVLMYKESEVLGDLKQMNSLYVLLCLCGGIAICLFTYSIKRIVLDPIQTLVNVQEQFGEGDLTARSKNTSQDEFGALSLSFNNMADQLSKRTTRIEKEVAERKRVETALRQEKEKFMVLIEESPFGISYISQDGGYQYINPKFGELFGYTLEDIPTGRIWFEKAFPNRTYRQNVISTWLNDLKEFRIGESRHRTFLVTCIDGTEKTIYFKPVTLKNGDQFVIHEDVTRQIQLEDQLRQSQKMEAIGTLASGIAHDFNNILSPLLGYAEMLKEDLSVDSPFQGSVNEIHRASLRARDLVQQILTFSRQTEDDLKPIKIQSVVKEAIKLLRSSLPKTIDIKQNIDSSCGAIIADPTQIHQIVMNLATNAYHAMEDPGGILTVALKQVQLKPDKLKFLECIPGTYACLSVKDTGVGIENDKLDKIFDPYFTTKGKERGTGLGLSVVHGIVNSCGGDIQIVSESGKGTEVYVYLPMIESQVEEKVDESMGTGTILGGTEEILLVDDEEAIVRMEQQMLEQLGYNVTTRTGSVDALEAFRTNPNRYDLIITDMSMPNMTGIKLAKEIKNIKPVVPIIICTGFSDQINEEKCESLGIQGYVMKPIVRKEFAETIREVIDKTQ